MKARAAVEKYKGNFLIRGGRAKSNEKDDSPRTVIIEFLSYDKTNAFYQSKEYEDAHSILKGHAVKQFQIIEGT